MVPSSLIALAAIAITAALVLAQPRVVVAGVRRRVGPAAALALAVAVLAAGGLVHLDDVPRAFASLGGAMLGVAGVMVLSAACVELGALELVARTIEERAGASVVSLFIVVFAGAWVTAGALNNDAAILVNTALVASLLHRRFAARGELAEPFLLAVFLGAGVAPLLTSNPMNFAFAHLAGIGFLDYARTMIPVSIVGAATTLLVLLVIYRRSLSAAGTRAVLPRPVPTRSEAWLARAGVLIIVATLVGYVVAAMWRLPAWLFALGGAAVALVLLRRSPARISARTVVTQGVSLDILALLPLVFLFAAALERAGIIDALRPLIAHQGALQIGALSAFGSALLNNHTMALININALVDVNGVGVGARELFAAMVGGDLGPRLLPFGSLAGLLWLDAIRRQGFDVSLRRFVVVGIATGVPSLIACLLVLRLL